MMEREKNSCIILVDGKIKYIKCIA